MSGTISDASQIDFIDQVCDQELEAIVNRAKQDKELSCRDFSSCSLCELSNPNCRWDGYRCVHMVLLRSTYKKHPRVNCAASLGRPPSPAISMLKSSIAVTTVEDTVDNIELPRSKSFFRYNKALDDITTQLRIGPGTLEVTTLSLPSKTKALYLEHFAPFTAKLRRQLGLEDAFKVAMLSTDPFKTVSTNSKSGEEFYRSAEGLFFAKTMSVTDMKSFLRISKDYFQHFETYPETLLSPFVGVYSIVEKSSEIKHVMIMANILRHCASPGTRIYDLKGSKINRGGKGLDDDFVSTGLNLVFPDVARQEFFKEQMAIDSNFLATRNLIDYSLLSGFSQKSRSSSTTAEWIIQDVSKEPEYSKLEVVVERSQTIRMCLGIIDFLQPYDIKKFSEHWLKTVKYGDVNLRHTVVPPLDYAKRFQEFLKGHCKVEGLF